MRLSARAIINYANINSFAYANQWIVRQGDTNQLYFQIIDLDQQPNPSFVGQNAIVGFPLAIVGNNVTANALRYLVGVGTNNLPDSITVTFPSNQPALQSYLNATVGNLFDTPVNFPDTNPSLVFSVPATQADPNDSSVWYVTIPANMTPNTGNVLFSISQGANINRFSVMALLAVDAQSNGGC